MFGLRFTGIVCGLLLGCFVPLAASAVAVAAPTPLVDLGQASTYAVISGASVGNTVSAVGAPHTTLRGDLGVKANAAPTGFPPGVVTGALHIGDQSAADAHADLVTAYTEVAARRGGAALAGELAGVTLAPGLHATTAAVSNTGTVTLDGGGDPSSVFVFEIGAALTMAVGAKVTLTNGAQASHVFWQVNGAASVGAGARFAGTLMALDAVAVGAGTQVNGRLLARNGAVSLDSNEVYSAPPTVTVDGGASATTTDTTPTISGTTDVEAPGVVTVTIAGQTLTATPADAGWSVTSPLLLANGVYPVVASVRDGAGNAGSATQQLTVDTVLPIVTIDGGPSLTTNDPSPTISGTSDVAVGTTVRVSVGARSLTALVQAGGTWNVTPSALSDGVRTVTARVTDPAGNVGIDTQLLTLDSGAPDVTITGGATALTNDATPEISGTADVTPGTIVTVTVALQTLTAEVQVGGAWSVDATALPDGPVLIRMSVTDTPGNPASATQTLTIDTVAPAVAISGGAAATTDDPTPTLSGTSDAAPGTTVTIVIAGQTFTTLLQANGTWNATPTDVGAGTWAVVASVPDPAGNLGSAAQTLTVTPVVPGGPAGPSGPAGPAGAGGTGATGGIVSTGGTGATGGSGSTGGDGSTGGAGSRGGTGSAGGTGSRGGAGGAGGTRGGPRLTVSLSAARFTTPRGKRMQLPFVLNGPAKVTLTLTRGRSVLATLSTTRRAAGRASLTWNGKIKRKLASRGSYRLTVRAVSPSGASARDTATLRIR